MFRHVVLITMSLLVSGAQAGMYRWVDDQGNVHYGDKPPPEGAEPIRLHGYLPPAAKQRDTDALQPGASDTETADGAYKKLTISQPAADATLSSADGKVVLQLVLEPGLQAEHYLEVTLDGAVVGGKQSNTVLVLQGVARGRHVVQFRVFDAEGRQLGSSNEVRFYLRHSSPAEREGAEQDYQEWLTQLQQEREAAIEAERREQRERQLREQAEQKARIEERRRSDFEAKQGDSPVLKNGYPEVPATKTGEEERYKKDRTDLQAPTRPKSTKRHNELQTYDPAEVPRQPSGESGDFDPQTAPKSDPIKPYTGSTPNPAYAPTFTPPPAPSGD